MNVFEEAGPLVEKLNEMLMGQRLPVVAYAAALVLETTIINTPAAGRPEVLARLLATIQEMREWMVQVEAMRIRAAEGTCPN